MQISPSRKKRKKNGKTNLKTTREIIKKTAAITKRVIAFLTLSVIMDFSLMLFLTMFESFFKKMLSVKCEFSKY
jgi:hypothetical protein